MFVVYIPSLASTNCQVPTKVEAGRCLPRVLHFFNTAAFVFFHRGMLSQTPFSSSSSTNSMLFHSQTIHVLFGCMIIVICTIPSISSLTLGNDTDHMALLSFKADLTFDPLQILPSWNESSPFCSWIGVTCSQRHQRVVAINLWSGRLSGSISPAIGNLSFLRVLLLHNNSLTGTIPEEIGRLSRLRRLGIGNNSFSGEIPANISRCVNLLELDLSGNNLEGTIPVEFHSLTKLLWINLHSNNLTGEVPDFIGNFSSLTYISGLGNNFRGRIPITFARLTNLWFIGFALNNLSGVFPTSIFNLSSLTDIDLLGNQLEGNLPSDIGQSLPGLVSLNLVFNKFTGSIPFSLSNASKLVKFAINQNHFTGNVPNFDGLQSLQHLALDDNLLGNGEADNLQFLSSLVNCTKLSVLGFGYNKLGGVVPRTIGNFSKLKSITMGRNSVSGNIPSEIGDLLSLERLYMSSNLFTGKIPDSIGKLSKLGVLSLFRNKLSGPIPSSLGNLTQLTGLQLQINRLEGSIPSSIAKCRALLSIDLSQNNLNSYIPEEILSLSSLSVVLNLSNNHFIGSILLREGGLPNLVSFDVSNNLLSGVIPGSLGSFTSLSVLSMGGNSFQGGIPPSLSSLRGLEVLDLSRNNLTGRIPVYLANFLFLRNLNLSFNDLEGEVPQGGVFRNITHFSVNGNVELCGGIPEVQLPMCPRIEASRKGDISRALILIIPIVSGVLVLILVVTCIYVYKWRKSEKISVSDSSTRECLLQVSYGTLYKATDGFSSVNLIGSGKFSSVYKGILDQNGKQVVAVKVLNLQVLGASKSFVAECEALRSIRHRNLVKIVTSCSSIDFQGKDFKALVYSYVVNGSLEGWLHPNHGAVGENEVEECKSLSLLQRLTIVIDVAHALDYLHHHCGAPLVHCDLKPSNVLLDIDLVAHIGDFGLARFLPKVTDPHSTSQTSSYGIKGTIGYAAPEYGMGSKVSIYGDVYSYGILILEIFTGKCPTDDMFNNGLNLHNFVKMAIPNRVMEITDPLLVENEEDEVTIAKATHINKAYDPVKECLVSVFKIGIACSMDLARERMQIGNVVNELHMIKETLLGSTVF